MPIVLRSGFANTISLLTSPILIFSFFLSPGPSTSSSIGADVDLSSCLAGAEEPALVDVDAVRIRCARLARGELLAMREIGR